MRSQSKMSKAEKKSTRQMQPKILNPQTIFLGPLGCAGEYGVLFLC